jgi:hypothetical protein
VGGNLGGMPTNPSGSIAGQFLRGDFFNYSLFASGLFDSGFQSSGVTGGFSLGGGISAAKTFSSSSLALNYHGDYRNYSSGFQGTGTNQYLSLIYSHRLGRRWVVTLQEGGGILFYNNPSFGTSQQAGGGFLPNPSSPTSRFLESSVYVSYQQSARLSYVIGGTFMLSRYSYAGAFGVNGGLFTASAIYKLSARTSVGGTYSRDYYHYLHGAGDSNINGGYLNLTHVFGRGWNTFVSGGVTYVHAKGQIVTPLQIVIPGDGTITVGVITPYDTTSTVPTIQAGVRHAFGKYNVGFSGGHGVNPGNGTYLTSSHTFFSGSVSRNLAQHSVLAANMNFSTMKSISFTIDQNYSQSYISLSYSRVLTPHLSAFVSYNYSKYGSVQNASGIADNRVMVGISYNSHNIPFTFF